jgi:hypothetical protein
MPISTRGFAAGISGMARALEEMELIGGHIEWSTRNVPRLIIETGRSGAECIPKPFDIAFDGGDFTLSNCVYRRGPVTKEIADIPGEIVDDGTQYIAVWIDSEAGTGAAYVGATIASVTDATVNVESTQYKVLLYKIEAIKTGEGEEAVMSVRVVVDYRTAQAVVLYI